MKNTMQYVSCILRYVLHLLLLFCLLAQPSMAGLVVLEADGTELVEIENEEDRTEEEKLEEDVLKEKIELQVSTTSESHVLPSSKRIASWDQESFRNPDLKILIPPPDQF